MMKIYDLRQFGRFSKLMKLLILSEVKFPIAALTFRQKKSNLWRAETVQLDAYS